MRSDLRDILIIGGGAAGLACALSARDNGKNLRITVIDRMPKLGKKILVTGNGRCNLSSANMSEKFYHGSVDIKSLLSDIPDIRPFFGTLGLFTRTDGEGRIYPLSGSAASVNDALRLGAEGRGIELLTDCECKKIDQSKNIFTVRTSLGDIGSKTVVLACGGKAASVHGSNGSGFALAQSLGLALNTPYPALCALTADGMKGLEGVRAPCRAELEFKGKTVKTESGEVQFTKSGLSGICIFNLSACFDKGDYTVNLDLAPALSVRELKQMLTSAAATRRHLDSGDCFGGIFNRPLCLYLLKRAGISPSKPVPKLTNSDFNLFAENAKRLSFKITGRSDFASAQVTAGGVKGDEINGGFMSKKIKGLFLCGEILDIWGDCGGYNLHFAFASGIKAGIEAARFVEGAAGDRAL